MQVCCGVRQCRHYLDVQCLGMIGAMAGNAALHARWFDRGHVNGDVLRRRRGQLASRRDADARRLGSSLVSFPELCSLQDTNGDGVLSLEEAGLPVRAALVPS